MKNLIYTFIAVLSTSFLFTSCNSAEVKIGQEAGKAFVEAYNSSKDDLNVLNAAYMTAANSFLQTAQVSDQANMDWQNGFIDACKNDMEALGAYYACYAAGAAVQGQDISASISTMVTNLGDKGAAFKASYDNTMAKISAGFSAPAADQEAVEEAAEESTEEETEE